VTDPRALLAELAVPRLPGTAANARVRAILTRELAARGFVVMEHAFAASPVRVVGAQLWGAALGAAIFATVALALVPGGGRWLAVWTPALLVALGAVPDDSARVQFDRWLTRRLASAAAVGLPWWAASGDTASIRRFVALSDSVVPAGSAQERRLRLYDAARGSAYLALAQRDTDAALRAFEALPDSLCGGCREAFPWTHLTRAELLTARGRGDEAVRLLAPGVPWWPRPLTVLTALARARAADRVGDRDEEIRDYRFVASAWAHADVELKPVVAEANAAVVRLAGQHPR